MNKHSIPIIFSALAFLAVSCAPSVSRTDDYGKVTVAFGGPSARALETGWPGGVLPSFSSVTVTVSAPDMPTVTESASDSSGSLTVQVPVGTGRLVELRTVPASDSTAPYFAKAYAGSATVDITEGQTTPVTITLALSETKIVLQDPINSVIRSTNSISGPLNAAIIEPAYMDTTAHTAFDQYGRLYYYNKNDGILYRYNHNLATPESLSVPAYLTKDFAISPSNQRLYYFGDYALQYIDVTQTGEPSSVGVTTPSEVMYYQAVVAVDDTGDVYACSYDATPGQERVVKLSVGAESGGYADSTLLASMPFSNVGLTSSGTALTVEDLYVQDGALYILASQADTGANVETDIIANAYSRGKVVVLNATNLSLLWETGLSKDPNHFPTDPDSEFYGPRRFVAIAPKKLYIADDGFYWNGLTTPYSTHYINKSRIVELDLDAQAITATGLDGAVDFFEANSATYVVY